MRTNGEREHDAADQPAAASERKHQMPSGRQVPSDQLAAGEQYNPGAPTTPRQAATVIVLRGGDQRLEVLLVKRTPKARFMGGVWVFPGGAVDDVEGDGDGAHRAAAVRELREEAAIELGDPGALVKFSRWITPAAVQIRFDTHFFLAPLPDDQQPGSTARSASISAGSPRRRRSTRSERARSRSCSRRSSTSSRWPSSPRRRRCSSTPAGATCSRCSRACCSKARSRACCCPATQATERRRGRATSRPGAVAAGRRAAMRSSALFLRLDHVRDGVDQPEVGERLRVVPKMAPARGLELLGVQP